MEYASVIDHLKAEDLWCEDRLRTLVSRQKIVGTVGRLARTFGIDRPDVRFHWWNEGSSAGSHSFGYGSVLKIGRRMTLHEAAHEFAHILADKRHDSLPVMIDDDTHSCDEFLSAFVDVLRVL
jgi:hypothetical protein